MNNITEPTVSRYKGNPIISLPMRSGKCLSFGLHKAAIIVKYFEHIEMFATHQARPTGEDSHLDNPPVESLSVAPERY